jgi:hypothetical protein
MDKGEGGGGTGGLVVGPVGAEEREGVDYGEIEESEAAEGETLVVEAGGGEVGLGG